MWDLGTRLVHTALFLQISLFFFFLQTAQEPTEGGEREGGDRGGERKEKGEGGTEVKMDGERGRLERG